MTALYEADDKSSFGTSVRAMERYTVLPHHIAEVLSILHRNNIKYSEYGFYEKLNLNDQNISSMVIMLFYLLVPKMACFYTRYIWSRVISLEHELSCSYTIHITTRATSKSIENSPLYKIDVQLDKCIEHLNFYYTLYSIFWIIC